MLSICLPNKNDHQVILEMKFNKTPCLSSFFNISPMLDLLLPFLPSARTEIGTTKFNSVSELYLSLFSGWVKKDVPEGTHTLHCQNFHCDFGAHLWKVGSLKDHTCRLQRVMSFCLG